MNSWSPYDQQPQRYQPAPQKQSPNMMAFFMGLIIVAALLFVYAHQSGLLDGDNEPRDREQQTIVEPDFNDNQQQDDTPQADKPKIGDTYIVRIFESAADKELWLTKQVNNEQFWIAWVADQGMALHTLDPVNEGQPNPQAETFVNAAKERGIDAPFWMHVKKGGVVLSITPFQESVGEDTWKTIIQNSVQ